MALSAVRNDEPVDGLAPREAWARQTREALMTVSTLQRTVLELSYFKSMTESEIARQLGIPLADGAGNGQAAGLVPVSVAPSRRPAARHPRLCNTGVQKPERSLLRSRLDE